MRLENGKVEFVHPKKHHVEWLSELLIEYENVKLSEDASRMDYEILNVKKQMVTELKTVLEYSFDEDYNHLKRKSEKAFNELNN